MAGVTHFAILADIPDRAINFCQEVFGWRFEVGWEYDTPQGREKYWHVITGDSSTAGINGGLTRREYPGQPIAWELKFRQSMRVRISSRDAPGRRW
jgi:predicted enzyme related to lactoylglutathione lyase